MTDVPPGARPPSSGPDAAGLPPAGPEAPQPVMNAAWGRRAARVYLIVCGLTLAAMAIETVLGHAGAASILAAILAVPWSMLVSAFMPALPADWPMATGLGLRLGLLATFMLLNAAIVAGMAARTERDLRRPPRD